MTPDCLGQIAVVTGSSSGIGRAIALELAAAGADLVIHARASRAQAEQVAAEVVALGRQALVVMADVAEPEARGQLVEQAWNWQGRIDTWVNNAGADILTGELVRLPFEQKLARLWQVDVEGTIALSRAIGERMVARGGGQIVNIGWDQSATGMAGESGEMFAAVKGAVTAFSRSLAHSLAPHVRVNVVAPGWIKTAWGAQASAAWQARATHEALLNRWGAPADVAAAVRFLASPAARFITAQVLPVNGGFAGSVRGGSPS